MGEIHVTMPMGIGDCHWTLMKMRGFRKHVAPHKVIAHIAHGEHHKSTEFVKLTPFFDDVVEDRNALRGVPNEHQDPKWSTLDGSHNWNGFDFCLQANGHLERGEPIETWLPEIPEIDYQYPIRLPLLLRDMMAPRILLYPSGTGPNNGFRTGWHRDQWQPILEVLNFHGYRPTFVGANTRDDMEYMHSLNLKGDFENLVGQTTLEQYLTLIHWCKVWFGLNSGGGIMAGAMRRRTIVLWSDVTYGGLLHPKMQRSWVGDAPDYHTFSYRSPDMETKAMAKLLEVLK